MSQKSRAEDMLRTLINLHEGVADGGDGITEQDWNAARDIMSPDSQDDPVVGQAYLVNGSGDLAMDYEARPWINAKCEVIRQTESGKWLVRHPDTGEEAAFSKRNLTITETAEEASPALKTTDEICEGIRTILKANDYKEGGRDARTAEFSFLQGLIFGNPDYAKRLIIPICLQTGRSILSIK